MRLAIADQFVFSSSRDWIAAARGKYSKENYVGIELAGLYWHFVDLVWVLLFTIVYLF